MPTPGSVRTDALQAIQPSKRNKSFDKVEELLRTDSLRVHRRDRDESMPIKDSLIAATALMHDLTMATRNRERLLTVTLEPGDAWERGLLEAAKPWGLSLPDAALGSEGLYD